MDLGLTGKTVVVTGGSSGIGLATVRCLLGEGANVAFCARGADRLAAADQALAADFGADRVLSCAFSVLDRADVDDFAAQTKARFGGCDGLITNAGQGRVSTFSDTSATDWRAELDLKFFSQINPIQAFLPMLRASGGGAIAAVNSLLAYQPEPHMVATSAARGGVQNLLKSLSVELAPDVRVNAVLLGLVDSQQWQTRFEARSDPTQTREDWFQALAAKKGIPLGRLGTPDEAAKALTYLVSDAASYVNGAQLELSGGVSRFA